MHLFEGIELSPAQFAQKRREMSHWVKLARDLYASKDTVFVRTMLYVEVMGDRRPYVVQRIFAHYNSLRRRAELDQINKWMKDNKRVTREKSDDNEAE